MKLIGVMLFLAFLGGCAANADVRVLDRYNQPEPQATVVVTPTK
jgi:hypothetical protein